MVGIEIIKIEHLQTLWDFASLQKILEYRRKIGSNK